MVANPGLPHLVGRHRELAAVGRLLDSALPPGPVDLHAPLVEDLAGDEGDLEALAYGVRGAVAVDFASLPS
jgi:hypothetical protein